MAWCCGITYRSTSIPQNSFWISSYNASSNSIDFGGTNTITDNTSGAERIADDLHNLGTANVKSGTTTVDALYNTGSVNVGGEGSSATLAVRKSWTGDNGKMNVASLGTLSVDKDIVFDANGVKENINRATVEAGGTYEVTGLGSQEVTLDDLSSIASGLTTEESKGLINLGNVSITGLTPTECGHIEYDTKFGQFETNELITSTVDVTNEQNANGISGGFQSVHLTGTDRQLVAKDSLVLAGSAEGGNLVSTGGSQSLGNLRIGERTNPLDTFVTLGREGYDNKGTLGTVTMSAGNANLTLRVVGNGNAEFEVADINGGNNANKTIVVEGATLKTGNISGPLGDGFYDEIQTVNITNGTIATNGMARVKDVTLTGGNFTASMSDETTGGDITISGDVSGQGVVFAEDTLTLSHANGLTTAEGDDLALQGNSVVAKKIDSSTDGKISIIATDTLTTDGGADLKDDVILAQNWTLDSGDAVIASGNSYQQVVQFTQNGQEATDSTSNLDTTYTLKDHSLLLHADAELASEAVLGQLRDELDKHGYTGPAYLTDKTLNLTTNGNLVVGTTETDTTGKKVVFGDNSVLAVDGNINGAVFTAEGTGNQAYVSDSSNLYAENVKANSEITIFDTEGFGAVDVTAEGWNEVQTDTAMLKGSYDSTDNTVTFSVQDARTEFPGLSDDLAPAVNDLYNRSLNDVDSGYMGVRFLSRATNDSYLGRKDLAAAVSTIESAARIAFAGAVPQMTKMASDAATNAVVNRLGFANPDNGAKAMNVDGKLVDDKALGLALWIAPLWSNQTGFGMEAGNLDYGYNANLGGISLGADYTWANNIRAGLMFNIGGGYAESAGGDLSETTNSMTFWGVGAYGGWEYNNFAVMADVSYTSTWNSVDQDVDHRMQMGDLEADIQASAISAGLRFEYKLETQYLDLIPHVGARYMSINTWDYDVETNGGTVLEGDGFQQNIWTFPVGITFSKELEMNNDWYFKPSVDFTVIPAAGDIKAKEDVRFTGLPYSTEIETQMMDYFTWQGGVGLEFGNDNMSVGVNYTLQAGQNSTGHGVFGMFRYEF